MREQVKVGVAVVVVAAHISLKEQVMPAKDRPGFTLVEVIASMVIIAIVMYTAITIFISGGMKSANVDVFTVAQSLAEGKVEELLAKTFTLLTDEASASFSGTLSSYSFEVLVNYVSQGDLNTPVLTQTSFKKILVMIFHPKLALPISLEALKVNY